jgi:hypothetical protein
MSILDKVQESIDGSILIDLENKLKEHDWFYFMSDDPRVNASGRSEAEHIRYLLDKAKEEGLEQEALDLYKKYKKTL